MQIRPVLALPMLFAAVALANPPPAEHQFVKRLPNTETWVPIDAATLDDHFCFRVKGFATDGEHVAEIAIYDANGREFARAIRTVTARGATWRAGFCPGPAAGTDVPGEWWFVATIDDTPVISASINVAHGVTKPGTPAPATPATPLQKKEVPRYPRARQAGDGK